MLDISVTDGGSGRVLVLAGEADLTTVAELNRAWTRRYRPGSGS